MKTLHRLPAVLAGVCLAAANFAQAQPQSSSPAQTPAPAQATAPTLHVGDPAPPLAVGKWLRGDPITSYSPSQTYVIVFWSTWCAAFLPAITHLDELEGQLNHQITVAAISVFESNRATLYDYVNKLAYKMDFAVASDNVTSDKQHGLDGTMANSWLVASRQMGLPIAFIVDRSGKIAWIGSPVGPSMDEPLRKIADGSWDTAAFANQFNSEQQRQIKSNAIGQAIATAIAAKNWDEAFKSSDELTPYDSDAAAVARYFIMLEKKDYAGAYDYCKQLEQGPFSRDARGLYSLGWITVNPAAHFEKTNYDLGIEILKKAVDLTYRKNPEMLDALAWAYFQKGDKDDAVEYEQVAITVAREDQLGRLNQNLDTFKKK